VELVKGEKECDRLSLSKSIGQENNWIFYLKYRKFKLI